MKNEAVKERKVKKESAIEKKTEKRSGIYRYGAKPHSHIA